MRLLFVTAAPRRWTGGELVMTSVAQGLWARGHDVLLTYDPRGPVGERMGGDVPRLAVPVRGDADPRAILRIRRLIRERRIDVVCANRFRELKVGGLAARLAGRARVVNRIGLPAPLPNDLRRRLVYRALLDMLVLDNAAGVANVRRENPWFRGPVVQARNGVDVAALSRVEPAPRADFGAAPDEVVVASLGRLGHKGSGELAAAAARLATAAGQALPPLRLVYLGEANEAPAAEVRRHLAGAGDAVRLSLLGHRPSAETLRIVAAADLVVRASDADGISNSVLEAMALGVPVVASAVGGLLEAVDDGRTGLRVPVGDTDALAAAIAALAGNAGLRREMGAAARARVAEHFTRERTLDDYEAAFRSIMADAEQE